MKHYPPNGGEYTILTAKAPAKLNLSLHVTGRRADGYHALESLMVFLDLADTLQMMPADTFSLSVKGPFADTVPTDSHNLVLQAAIQLAERSPASQPVQITLDKQIPVAAGLGGGSADAAAMLRTLAKYWHYDDPETLMELAVVLGADVPVCMASRSTWVGGMGESLLGHPVLPPLALLLVNPRTPVATATIFKQGFTQFRAPSIAFPSSFDTINTLCDYLAETSNDLTRNACLHTPVIGEVLGAIAALPGVRLSRMSGSGATCFGLFTSPEARDHAYTALKSSYPDWWILPANTVD
ncbi:MAG: 4-(cytidine 5'-diphospho)-2-C-methyl-D-erythritol kinase [Hyphomicrobiales bacterium]|nr:4-(cytidine 5'-diphospho)-2-C-methyl-D-erythritol kinase [Hyphomicrobiales bacterium]